MSAFRALARALVDGNGQPRTRADLYLEIERALEHAHAEGVEAGRKAELRRGRREVLHALEGAVQALELHAKTARRDLENL